uniref:Major facilitator superfamily (MFS) profile domain-containing protein n=1 Tax=Amphimedon queenslandica TaxID=400682 RepID=A0A1X7V8H0_AMPQE
MSNFFDKMKQSRTEKERLVFGDPRKAAQVSKLALWRKVCYAVGSMPYAMCNTVIGYYFTFFLLEVALLDPTYALMIVLLGRVWDGISDPICGYLCSRTKTKLGQFRPWLLLSAFPTAIVYFCLWYVPHFEEDVFNFLYYLIMYFLLQTLLTCVHVPYTALTMHLSYNQKEIDSVTLYRVIFEMFGTLLGIGIYTVSFTIFVRGADDDCVNGIKGRDIEKERAFRYHAAFLGVLIVLMILTTFFTVREQKEMTKEKTKLSIKEILKETWSFKPYRYLFFIELFSWLAVQFGQGNFTFYAKYVLKLDRTLPYVIFLLMIINIFWLPIWQLILSRIGKKTAFVLGAWILMPSFLSLLYLGYYPNLVWVLGVVIGGGISAAYLLPWSMLPDVVDDASLKTGIRREELFYSFFVFGNKFSSGITLGISTGVYKLAGYDQLACVQPWTVPLLFKLLVSCPPVIFILISLIFLWRYPINEERRAEIKEKLQKKRQTVKESVDDSIYSPSSRTGYASNEDRDSDFGNTSGALGVRYMIGCCNSSSCVGPSDFFDDINVDITWPLLQRAPILTSSTIEPTGVTVATGASTDGGSSSFLACSTCSPSVSNKKFDYKPYYIFSPIIFVEIFLIFLFLILWIRKCRRVCLRVKQEQANKKQDECIFKLRNRRGTCP